MGKEKEQARYFIEEVPVFCAYDEVVSIDNIKPNPKNPNMHPDEQIRLLADVILKTGVRAPITVSKLSGLIVKGHGRLEAAKVAGLKEFPVEYQHFNDDDEEMAALLADNKIAELAEIDNEKLKEIFNDFEFEDLTITGFSEEELKELTEIFEETELLGDPDEVPEEVVTRAKLGDIWQLGNHRLMCGDSTSITDVEKLMDGDKADMVFTDPPYGYNYQSNMRVKSEKFDVLKNDDKILDFFPLLKDFNNGFVFVCTTWKVLNKWLPLFEEYYNLSNMIIWNKGGGGIGDLKHTFSTDYEIILCSNNGAEIKGKRIGSVWAISKDNANDYIHATQKPVALSSLAIENVTKIKDIVLDVFGGSGSTLIACEQLNRKCYTMELDPHYVDVIITRWENLTGKKAVLCS